MKAICICNVKLLRSDASLAGGGQGEQRTVDTSKMILVRLVAPHEIEHPEPFFYRLFYSQGVVQEPNRKT